MAKPFVTMELNNRDIRLYRDGIFKPAKKQLKEIAKYVKGTVAGTVFKSKVGRLARLAIQRNFKMKRDASGVPWMPLEASTKRIRKKLGFAAGPPLIRSKRLFNSAAGAQTVTFSRRGLLIRPRSGRISLRHKYSLHNRPSDDFVKNPQGSGKDIPGRQFYYLDSDDYEIVAGIMLVDMVGRLNAFVRGKSAEGIAFNLHIKKLKAGVRQL